MKRLKHRINAIINRFYWVSWDSHKNNFGDILTPYIVEHFTNKKVKRVPSILFPLFKHFFVIGSILQKCTSQTEVWGSGFISGDSKCKENPKKIHAVRGPLTKAKLDAEGIVCPEVFGDLALLMPEIYDPSFKKKYEVGILPHYVDKNHEWLEKFEEEDNVLIIDVQQKNPLNVIDDILSCDKIISSSLHGLIVADAYGVPSIWIEFSDKIVGNGFKFLDYFLSVQRKDRSPVNVKEGTELEDVLEKFYEYEIDIDLEKLKMSCPF